MENKKSKWKKKKIVLEGSEKGKKPRKWKPQRWYTCSNTKDSTLYGEPLMLN